jgi:hypothetical protein
MWMLIVFGVVVIAMVAMAVVIDRNGGSIGETSSGSFKGSSDHDIEASRGQGRGLGDGGGGFGVP